MTVQGIKGPQIAQEDEIVMPDCVNIKTQKDQLDMSNMVISIVQATNRNAVKQLEELIGEQEPELIRLFKLRLNVRDLH